MNRNVILCGDVREQLRTLPDESVHCVVTSPPYWGLRDYGTASWEGGDPYHAHRVRDERSSGPGSAKQASSVGANFVYAGDCACGAKRVDLQLGLEATPEEFVCNLVDVFREVRRVLRKDGTVWLNLGDSYALGGRGGIGDKSGLEGGRHNQDESRKAVAILGRNIPYGLKPKDLVGQPWRVAFALQADGWWLRSDIIWSKPNPMPESVTDRPTRSHEYLFLLAKSERYYYDIDAIKEPASPNTHARLSQASLNSQRGGFKQEQYQEGLPGKKGRDRSPNEILHAMAKQAGVNPKAAQNELGSKQNASFSAAVVGPVLERNRRSVWEIPTEPFPGSHFATFPTELVKPCILAGTSEYGCCSVCGAPWRRVVEVEDLAGRLGTGYHDHTDDLGRGQRGVPDASGAPIKRTTGWQPTCTHEAPIVPAVVLDIFGGSGTTGEVASKAGRDYILIELNPAYVEMAERRLAPVKSRLL